MQLVGVSVARIATPTIIIFLASLIAAVVLTITGNDVAAGPLFGVAFGAVAGASATTGVIAQQVRNGNGTGNGASPPPTP